MTERKLIDPFKLVDYLASTQPRANFEQEGNQIWGTPKPGQVTCDFCLGETVTHRVRCREDFALPEDPTLRFIGDWAACTACAAFIRDDQWDQLTDRVVMRYGAGYRPYLRRLYRVLRERVIGVEEEDTV